MSEQSPAPRVQPHRGLTLQAGLAAAGDPVAHAVITHRVDDQNDRDHPHPRVKPGYGVIWAEGEPCRVCGQLLTHFVLQLVSPGTWLTRRQATFFAAPYCTACSPAIDVGVGAAPVTRYSTNLVQYLLGYFVLLVLLSTGAVTMATLAWRWMTGW